MFRATKSAASARLAYDADTLASRTAMLTGKSATRSAICPKTEVPSQLRLKQKTSGTRQKPAQIAHETRGGRGKAAANNSRIGLASRFNLTDRNHSHSERG